MTEEYNKCDMGATINKIEKCKQPTAIIPFANEIYKSKVDIDNSIMLLILVWAECRSKDPNTKVGSAVYDFTTGALHLGYNGFPPRIMDLTSRWNNRDKNDPDCKYSHITHGEINAVRKAQLAGFSSDSVLYITHYPCRNCVKDAIIPSGIKKVIYLYDYPYDAVAEKLLEEANVKLLKLNLASFIEFKNSCGDNHIEEQKNDLVTKVLKGIESDWYWYMLIVAFIILVMMF